MITVDSEHTLARLIGALYLEVSLYFICQESSNENTFAHCEHKIV